MLHFINSLSKSDIINIISIIASLIPSIVAIVISIKSLRQNNKMIEASSRPYISIYVESITLCEQTSFFVIKNFGNTPAYINDFQYDPILKKTKQSKTSNAINEQFDYVKGITLAPGQSKMLEYDVTKLPCDELSFTIAYSSDKHYCETFKLNVKNYIHIPVTRPSSHILENDERKVHTLREILEHLI